MRGHVSNQALSPQSVRATRCRLTEGTPGSGWRWRQQIGTASPGLTSPGSLQDQHVRTPKMARLEAAFFVAEGALAIKRLAQVATLADARETMELIEQLNQFYDAEKSAFRIEHVAAGYQLLTRSMLSPWLDRVHHRQARLKLSSPMMETLAIVAYRQPCTRADVEAVRGVQSAEIIKQLMERHLVRVTGEDTSLGRPYLYGTTRLFLETFGFSHLNDLPMSERLRPAPVGQKAELSESETSAEQTSGGSDSIAA